MIPLFGSRRLAANREVIERLNTAIVEAVRTPVFYLEGGVADTFNGRFELLVLHTALAVRRLRAVDEPGPAIAQALVDAMFRNLDPALRELGVGDMAVPKRMKRLAEAFLGRSLAYDRALLAGDLAPLEEALSRNVYAGARRALELAAYGRSAAAGIDAAPLTDFAQGVLHFPDPAVFLRQTDAE